MKFIYHGNAKKAGIYKITNIVSNKVYIGSAAEFKSRGNGHFSSLCRQKHRNKHLQAAFNKYGKEAFVFEVVEVISEGKVARRTREQYYLEQYFEKWYKCYNHKRVCLEKENTRFSNTMEESKQKISAANKKRWENQDYKVSMQTKLRKVWTQKKKRSMSRLQKELWADPQFREKQTVLLQSESRRQKISTSNTKTWNTREHREKIGKLFYFISPDGNRIEILNLRNWCKENSLSYNAMLKVHDGRQAQHKQWTC